MGGIGQIGSADDDDTAVRIFFKVGRGIELYGSCQPVFYNPAYVVSPDCKFCVLILCGSGCGLSYIDHPHYTLLPYTRE